MALPACMPFYYYYYDLFTSNNTAACLLLLKGLLKPRTEWQFFLDELLLLVYTRKNWQVFLEKEPGLKARHDSFQTRKTVRVWSCLPPSRKN